MSVGYRQAAACFGLAAVLGTTGCAALGPAVRVSDTVPAAGVLLTDVPFHPQTMHQCGPSALAGILGASGSGLTPTQLAAQVYLPERRGSLQLELIAATRRAGRIPYVLDRSPDAMLRELNAGRPVLLLQNLLTRSVPRWHYAVLVGADPAHNRLILNTGRRQAHRARANTVYRTWDWGGRWAMIALRPGELPSDADAARYLIAVADFEAVAGAAAAETAYRAATQRWPHDPRPWLALGNQAYQRGDAMAAVRHYGKGLRSAPQDPVLNNNLASVLGEQGCKHEALAVLDTISIGLETENPWREAITKTRLMLEKTAPRPQADICRFAREITIEP